MTSAPPTEACRTDGPAHPAEQPAGLAGPGSAWSGLRALAGHLRPQRGRMLAGVALGLLGSVLGLAQPLAAKHVMDIIGHGQPAVGPVVVLSTLVVAGGLLAGLGHYVLDRSAESVVCTVRRRLTHLLPRLRVPVIEHTEPGDLIARVTSDTVLLRRTAPQAVSAAVTGTLITVATVVMMGLLDAVLLGVTLTVIAFVGLVVIVVTPHIGRATRHTQEAVGRMGAGLERTLGALRTVKAAGAEQHETAALHRAAEHARRTGVRAAAWEAVSATLSAVVLQVCFLVVLGVGGARVTSGSIGVSTLVAFLLYLFALTPRIGQLVEGVGQLQIGAAAAVRIREAETMEVEEAEGGEAEGGAAGIGGAGIEGAEGAQGGGDETAVAPERPPGTHEGHRHPATVAFQQVHFAYRPGLPAVHRHVSFAVPAGGVTAIVGPSGAGKTTVFALIERFYEPDAGRVLLDGRDIRRWPLAELRAAIGYVEQDPTVLAGTLRDNLTLGAADATDEQIAHILRLARLDTVTDRLPHGLDTQVGHRGSRLSGGERQRVAIARALLRRPRLLLLDEATSQLDAANEAALRETVTDTARRTTVLVVAHRLSTVTSADRILVMEAGRVRARGTHAELMAHDSLYAELASTQLIAVHRRRGPSAPVPEG
ncbi:ABC transporter ATP-binding protein [Streptomyces griseoflavus]|uniref:ABC transporter ATP-binding protein n=1 Tax=Streptomyces rimosus TaxID=1927 RepID=UPI0004C4D214|nr:ABC transporter ATP-binding protein [Streptomyces rimosus]KOG61467.1 ABC transporter ATP-binding protein [Streptomyces griseoflavus]